MRYIVVNPHTKSCRMLDRSDVTKLLQNASTGDSEAFDQLYALVYDELVRLAHVIRKGRGPETLNTTSLVHEAYFKLIATPGNVAWKDRTHFFAVAARAMRQVLVDASRDRLAQKRGGGQLLITLDERQYSQPVEAEGLLALHEALGRLEHIDERQVRIIECRFFAGLSVVETASALGISDRTVKRDWRFARAWLSRELA